MVAFTTDIWTDATTRESFISVTCHWINKFWQRRDFVLNCSHFPAKHTACNIVRDGASNMRAGCDEVPVDSVHCLIHLLQLVVKDAVLSQDLPARIVRKCRVLCTFVHNSARATAALRRKQVEVMGVVISQAKQLVGDVKTRWNSTYLMLLRIQTLRPALEQFMLDEAELPSTTSSWSHSKCLESNEWAMIRLYGGVVGPLL